MGPKSWLSRRLAALRLGQVHFHQGGLIFAPAPDPGETFVTSVVTDRQSGIGWPSLCSPSRIVAAAVVAMGVLCVGIAPAAANWFSFLEDVAGDAARLAAKAAREAAELARGIPPGLRRATLRPALDGGFRLADDEGQVIAAFHPGDHLAAAADLAAHLILIPEAVLTRDPGIVRAVLEQTNLHVAVVSGDGLWPLRLEHLGARTAILIDAAPTLSMTPEAFARRGTLESLAAAALIERMRVIPLIPSDDVIGVQAFRDRVARLAGVPDSREAALRLIEGSNQNLIVVTGHVEDNAFVVHPTTGPGFTVPFVDIRKAADATRSQVLLLGCQVACTTPFSGAVTDIFQSDVLPALSDLDSTGNVLSLLGHLSKKVGPLLIQEDQDGGFQVIDAAFARGQNSKLTRRGALLVRLVLQVGPAGGAPILDTLSGITLGMFLDRAAAVFVIVPLFGWLLVFAFGVGPVRAWRLIKEDRAERLGLKDKLARIRGRALPVYAFFGPWVVITRVAMIFGALFLSIVLLIASPMGGIVAWTVAISATINLRRR